MIDMNRTEGHLGTGASAQTRIVWRDGVFRVECAGAGSGPGSEPGLLLRVFYERFLMAEENVDSAESAWQRGSEICRQLATGDVRVYGRGLA